MERICSREMTIGPSLCGFDARLSVPAAFGLFMDIATEHAEELGMGLRALGARNLFWLTVRNRVRIARRPAMLERVTLTTWPEKPGAMRCDRSYTLTAGEETLLVGKTEFAVIDTATGRLHPMAEVYPPALGALLTDDTAIPEPFSRISEKFSPEETWGEYTVRSADIDLGGHMNNAVYPRVVMGAFSLAEQKAMDLREMELCYRAPCFEGDTLSLFRRQERDGTGIGAFLPDGKTVLLVKIR